MVKEITIIATSGGVEIAIYFCMLESGATTAILFYWMPLMGSFPLPCPQGGSFIISQTRSLIYFFITLAVLVKRDFDF